MKLSEFVKDPASGQGSMSRLCLPVSLGIDLLWMVAVILGWPPKESFVPVSGMLAGVTGTIAGIYAVSTHKSVGGMIETVQDAVTKVFQKAE